MKRFAADLFGASLASGFAAVACQAAANSTYELVEQSLAVSPDSRHVVVARQVYQEIQPTFELLILDLVTRDVRAVSRAVPISRTSPRPTWSPDGRRVAYFAEEKGEPRLYVWDLGEGRLTASSARPVCGTLSCGQLPPVWTADGHHIVYVREDARVNNRYEAISPMPEMELAEAELIGIDRSPAGAAIFVSSSIQDWARSRPWSSEFHVIINPGIVNPINARDIVSLNVETGREVVMANGRQFVSVSRAPNTGSIHAVIQLTTQSSGLPAYSVVALDDTECAPSRSCAAAPAQLRTVIERTESFGAPHLVFSSGGRIAALAVRQRGAAVIVVAGSEGTREISLESVQSPASGSSLKEPLRSDQLVLLWSNERQLLLVAPSAAPWQEVGDRARHQLKIWRVSVDAALIAPVSVTSPLEFETLAVCDDTGQPCQVGRNREFVGRALVGGKDRALVAVDPETGRHRVIAGIPTPGTGPMQPGYLWSVYDVFKHQRIIAANRLGQLAYMEAGLDTAPTLWEAGVDSPTRPHALSVLNPDGPAPAPRRIRVAWTNTLGQEIEGWLVLPDGAHPGERLPVIAAVYQGGDPGPRPIRFRGGPTPWYDRVRTQGRYALLDVSHIISIVPGATPESDYVPAARTGTCDFLTQNVLAALDAANRTGWIDSDRAGLIGQSSGGYFVNCVVSRTHRFKVAVSGEGISSYATYYGWGAQGDTFVGGTLWQQPAQYIAESPLFRADQIQTPLLIYYGKRDLYFSQQSRELFHALNHLGRPVGLMAFDDLDHSQMHSRDDYWRIVIDWFDRVLQPAISSEYIDSST